MGEHRTFDPQEASAEARRPFDETLKEKEGELTVRQRKMLRDRAEEVAQRAAQATTLTEYDVEAARQAIAGMEQVETHKGALESIKESLVIDDKTHAMLEKRNNRLLRSLAEDIGGLFGRSKRPYYDIDLMRGLVEGSGPFVDRLYTLVQSSEAEKGSKEEKELSAQLVNIGTKMNEGVQYGINMHLYYAKDLDPQGYSSLGGYIEENAEHLGQCIEAIGRGHFDLIINVIALHRGCHVGKLIDMTDDELALLNEIALPARVEKRNAKSIRALDEKLAPLGVMYAGPERGYKKVK